MALDAIQLIGYTKDGDGLKFSVEAVTFSTGKIIFPTRFGGGVFGLMEIEDDIDSILKGKSKRDIAGIVALLDQRIAYLDENGERAIGHTAWFERLKHYDGAYYALRIVRLANIRVIYTHIDRKPFLLYAFCETARGNAKTDSYKTACKIASARLGNFVTEGVGQCIKIISITARNP